MDSWMEESGMTVEEFSVLKVIVSKWYDENRCLSMLKVLFRDHVDLATLSGITKTIELLNELVKHGHLNMNNLAILCDTISITKQFALQWRIQKILPSFPDVTERTISRQFTLHRCKLMKFGMALTEADVRQIDGWYNSHLKNYTDSWSMIIDLEMRMEIIDGDMMEFFHSLEALKIHHALKALLGEQEIPAEILARGPDASKVYQAALEEGKSDFNLVRLMVMGQENVGKTCLINSLLGKKFIEEHIITEVIAMTRSLMYDKADNTKWTQNEIGHMDEIKDKHKNALATQIAEDLQNKETSSSEYTGQKSQKNRWTKFRLTGVRKRKKFIDGKEETKRSKTNTNDGTSQATASASPVTDIAQSQRMDEVIEKVVQVMKGKSLRDNSLRIWDYGGQLIYHSIHRFYMTPEGIFLIVFNIADDLDAYANVVDSSGKVHKHYMTNLEYLLYWIRSAYTYAKDDGRYTDDEINFPVCIIVATHRSSLSGSEEQICNQIKEKFAKIRKAIENQVYKSHVYPKYFAVENKLSSSDENIIALKKVILKMKEKMNRPIPHKWLDLLIAIQELSEVKVTLPLEQVISMARQCGISDETIDYAVTYLSDVGEIMYHPTEEALKDIVVIQPMKIVEYVKPVFTIVKPEDKAPRLNDDWKKLEKGLLTKCLLKHLWRKIPLFQNDPDEKMFNFFIKLMNKFGLTCQKKNETDSDAIVYYAVSHLHPTIHSLTPEDDQLNDKVSIFHDFCGFLPDHLFQLVVTKFIEKFQVENGHPTLAYEQAELGIDDQHYVRIAVATINHRRMLKTTIVRRRQPNAACELKPETCKKVLSFLQLGLKKFCKTSARGIQYKMCIPCTCSYNCQQMNIIGNFNKKTVSCGRFEIPIDRYCTLFGDASEAVPPSPGMQCSLNELTLLDVCEQLDSRWKYLGYRLGVTQVEIDCILTNCGFNIRDAKMKMLTMWKNRQSSKVNNMSVLSDALMKEGYVQIAERLLLGDTHNHSDVLHDSQLIFIAKELGTSWNEFGVHLGMKWNYMEELKSENRSNILNACMGMLKTWQQKQSVMTNQVAVMCEKLEKHGYSEVAEKLKQDSAGALTD